MTDQTAAWPKGRLVPHPQPGKVWVQVPHRNDIGSDWIEADDLDREEGDAQDALACREHHPRRGGFGGGQ